MPGSKDKKIVVAKGERGKIRSQLPADAARLDDVIANYDKLNTAKQSDAIKDLARLVKQLLVGMAEL